MDEEGMLNGPLIRLYWRWSLVSALVIGVFWFIWYLVNGGVPDNDTVFALPAISRGWDFLIGPIWSLSAVILLWTERWMDEILFVYVAVWGVGLVIALLFGLVPGLTILVTGSAAVTAFCLVMGLCVIVAMCLSHVPGFVPLFRWLCGR